MSIFASSKVVRTQVEAFRGPQGIQGEQGIQGVQGIPGIDGVSPVVALTREAGGVRITVTDAAGTRSEMLYDGADGTNGRDGHSNVIVCEASGSVIGVDDASDLPLYGLTICGRTTQEGTPAPDAPVPLVSAGNGGEIGVTVCGKNLIRYPFAETAGVRSEVTITHPGDGVAAFDGTAAATVYYKLRNESDPLRLNAGETYTLTGCPSGGSSDGYNLFVQFNNSDGNTVRYYDIGQGVDFTVPMDVDCQIVARISGGLTVSNLVFYPMLRRASIEDSAFAPYMDGGSMTVSTPDGLPGIPVSSGGNYTDENGQQWICDEIDLERGVYVQRIGSETLNGSESWSAGTHYFIYYIQGIYADTTTGLLCTGHVYSTNSPGTLAVNEMTQGSNPRNICFGNPDDMTLDAWKAALAAMPLTLLYPLSAPVETALTDAEIAAYQAMHTNKLITIVVSDGGAGMRMAYAADTKTYIDRQIAAAAALLAN